MANRLLARALHRVAQPVLQQGQREFGVGDVVHGVTHRLGVKHCAPCAKRKAALNKKKSFSVP